MKERYRTKFKTAEEVLHGIGASHIQVSETLIVPKKAIKDVYIQHGIVEFADGSSEFIGEDQWVSVIAYYRSRPRCHCGFYFRITNEDGTRWRCEKCRATTKIKED